MAKFNTDDPVALKNATIGSLVIWEGSTRGRTPTVCTRQDAPRPTYPPCPNVATCPYSVSSPGPARLRIIGYFDGMITPCGFCTDEAPMPTTFDGTYSNYPFSGLYCVWAFSFTGVVHIDGKHSNATPLISFGTSPQPAALEGHELDWILTTGACFDGGILKPIWAGFRSGIETPVGEFTRFAGCDTTATLTTEEY